MAYRILSSSRKLEKILRQNFKVHNVDSIKYTSTFRTILNEWRLFCEKPPKGFEKYFKPQEKGAKPETKPKDAKEAKQKDGKAEPPPSPKPSPPPGGVGGKPPGSRPYDQWSFGLFGGTGNRGSGGKPFGEGDKEKWYIFGGAGAIALLATLAFWEMGYKEIGWKEFVHKYFYHY